MNTIASLIPAEPQQAENAVENLADLFRISLSDARDLIPLSEELDLCHRYLDIEALRLGERLKQAWHIEALPKDALVPPLLIQPLLENAIYHGIEPLTDGGTIEINGQMDNRLIVGLYGKHGNLQIETDGQYYQVTIHFPYQNEYEDPDRR